MSFGAERAARCLTLRGSRGEIETAPPNRWFALSYLVLCTERLQKLLQSFAAGVTKVISMKTMQKASLTMHPTTALIQKTVPSGKTPQTVLDAANLRHFCHQCLLHQCCQGIRMIELFDLVFGKLSARFPFLVHRCHVSGLRSKPVYGSTTSKYASTDNPEVWATIEL